MVDQDTAAATLPADALDTAASQVTTNVPVVAPTDRVVEVLAGLPGHSFDSVEVIAVCEAGALVGAVRIEQLLAAASAATVAEVMDPSPPVVGPGTNQEHLAWQAVDRGEPGLIVVDEHRRFRGMVLPQRLLEVLLEEHEEDLARLGGFLRSAASARGAATEGVRRRLWHRLPWLLVGLGGATSPPRTVPQRRPDDDYRARRDPRSCPSTPTGPSRRLHERVLPGVAGGQIPA